jgi:hypothetical protein
MCSTISLATILLPYSFDDHTALSFIVCLKFSKPLLPSPQSPFCRLGETLKV